MPASFINDPEHWRQRAAQMRALAEEVQDDQAKKTMLRIAKDYDRLAVRAEQRAKGLTPAASWSDRPIRAIPVE